MNGICDIHSHILPGLDDGARTMEETIQVLKAAVEQGVDTILATPHYHPGRYAVDAGEVLARWREVKAECRRRRLPIRIYPGQECCYFTGLVKLLEEGEALTLAGSPYVLVEFPPESPFSYLQRGLHELFCSGYSPILAHFERYECLKKEENLRMLKEQEILLQMNFDTMLEKDGFFRRNPWKKYVQEGWVDFLGSDCHGTEFRPLRIAQSLEWMKKHVRQELQEQMLYRNPKKIIRSE